jgi:hypothetical protein
VLKTIEELRARLGCEQLTVRLHGDSLQVRADAVREGLVITGSEQRKFSVRVLERTPDPLGLILVAFGK